MGIAKSKRILSLVIAAVFAMTGFVAFGHSAEKAYAEEGVEPIDSSLYVLYYPKDKEWNTWEVADSNNWTVDMTSAKSSNPKVAVLKSENWDGAMHYYIYIKKKGKASITFKAKAKGTEQFVSKKVYVNAYAKYVCPVKTFKIGKKSYKSKFNKRDQYSTVKPVKGKLNIKAKKGWKIKSVKIYTSATDKSKKIKKTKNIKLKKGQALDVTFKKGRVTEMISIYRD